MNKMLLVFSVVVLASLWSGLVLADESLPKIVFDQGHGQRFLIGEKGELQLSGLADVVRGKGGAVTATGGKLTDEVLQGVAALVISGPFESLQADEVAVVARFLEKGGRLAAMLHVGPPLAGLLDSLDIDHSNAVLHERKNTIGTDINFVVEGVSPLPIFAGVTRFSLYGAWALKAGKNGAGIAHTSEQAWVDLDGDKVLSAGDAAGEFDVVLAGSYGTGSFMIFGDDAIFQNRYLDQDNSRLAANLADWLVGR